MDQLVFLQDLAIVMVVSAGIMVLCHLTRLPVVFGYITAGVIIGPNTPPFPLIHDTQSIHILSDLGVIFLLFFIGLGFSFRKLARVGLVSFVAANMEILLMMWIGLSIGKLLGWSFMDSLFLGAILSISSSTIIAKMLMEMKKMKEKFAQIILGVVVIDDILAIVVLAALSGLAATGAVTFDDAGTALMRVSAFVAVVLFFGHLFVPRLLTFIERFKSPEMMVLTTLGLCLGFALLGAKFGFSVGLGAFLVGFVIDAESEQGEKIARLMEPIRDMFTAIFFVSVGMFFQPALVLDYWVPILFITVAAMLGRIFSCSLATFLAGNKPETALRVGLGLAPIGEFSFIIARLGQALQVTSPFLYSIAVSVSGLTTIISPFLVRHADRIVRFAGRFAPKPLVNFAGLYTGAVRKIGRLRVEAQHTSQAMKEHKGDLVKIFSYMAAGTFLFFFISGIVAPFYGLSEKAGWALIGIVMFPVLAGLAYSLEGFLWKAVVLRAVKSPAARQSLEANLILHQVFRFFIIFFAGLLFLLIAAFFRDALPVMAALWGLLLVAALLLWGTVKNAYKNVEGLVVGVFDPDPVIRQKQSSMAHDDLVKLIHEQYPWEVEIEDFLVPYGDTALKTTVRDLQLRSETGATIVAVYRDTESLPNPPPETRILPGDVLLLMGDHDQVQRGVRFLHRKAKEKPSPAQRAEGRPETRRFLITEDSKLAGRQIKDVSVRKYTYVSILGLQKRDRSISNPGSEVILEKGDVLVLFGTSFQLDEAMRYLEQVSRAEA